MAENSLAPNDTEVVWEGEDEVPFDDRELSLKGMHMLLNNGFEEAFEMFKKHKEESPLMLAGYSFVFFMQALMSFEEEKLEEALNKLQETEKKCELGEGFIRSIKRKLSKKKRAAQQVSVEDKIQRQVITADSLLYQAVLLFINQDIPSYVKGGWLLRKAYKIYDKLYKEMTGLREKQGKLTQSSSRGSLTASSESDGPIDGNDNEIPSEVLDMLQGAVNFGYGTFQLCISLVPPKILKMIEFLGFEGDREVGLKALLYTSHSKDMKAPLAVLGLLWYHTVLRPFFALDGANEYDGGCEEAEGIIAENTETFPNSSLFLFFKGRIHRLRKQVDSSLTCYNQALDAAAGQREIELMCLYEIGWCNLMKLKWRESLTCFTRLKEETKWSKCYYTYLEAVCLGSVGDVKGAYDIFRKVPGLLKKKNNQIEAYCSNRAQKRWKAEIITQTEKMKKQPPTQEYCRLLTLELIFLWHALPTCTFEELRPYLDVCDMQTDLKVFHLKCLLEGSIFKELGETEMAIQCLDESIARHQGLKEDYHVPAFAHFELASVYMKNPQTIPKAKSLLKKIKDQYKDYDFENRLTVRVNNALKKLKSKA